VHEYRSAPSQKLYFSLAGIFFFLELAAIFGQWERWPFSGHALYAEPLRPEQVKVFEFVISSANHSLSDRYFLLNSQNCGYVERSLAWKVAELRKSDPSAPVTIESYLLRFEPGPVLLRSRLDRAEPCTVF
jgi:hypothetical protein